MKTYPQLEATAESALNAKFAKAVRHSFRATLAGPEDDDWNQSNALISIVGLENLTNKSHLVRVFLRLDSDVDTVLSGSVEQLPYGAFGGPDCGQLWLQEAVKQDLGNFDLLWPECAGLMRGEQLLAIS
ncbi:MAG TPA: hypothetical protein VGT24_07225 [Candidatus Acidoferrales bacterium]|nr:hypothetical protein [Candidatus Acidoferrales bacterium]